MVTPVETIETRAARVWLGDDGIVRVVMRPGTELTRADADELNHAGSVLVRGGKRLFLTDLRSVRFASRGARAAFAGDTATANCLAGAVLVESRLSTTIGNFFLGLNKPRFPVKLFRSEEDALAWLETFR